jgi:hypothetical protein
MLVYCHSALDYDAFYTAVRDVSARVQFLGARGGTETRVYAIDALGNDLLAVLDAHPEITLLPRSTSPTPLSHKTHKLKVLQRHAPKIKEGDTMYAALSALHEASGCNAFHPEAH